MKKSLKALILCGLASLVMFAVIYASPITAQAATHSITLPSYVYVDNGTGFVPGTEPVSGTVTINYSDGLTTNYEESRVDFWASDYCFFAVLSFDQDVSSETISITYSITLNGQTYSGNGYMGCPDPSNNQWVEFSLMIYGDNSELGDLDVYGEAIYDLENKIGNISNDATLTGENRVIEFNEGTALPGNIMAAMANSNGVTLKFTFWYEGFEFTTTITSEDAKRVFNPKVDWCGPCYLAENFPTVWTGKMA